MRGNWLRSTVYEGPLVWLWSVGVARIVVLVLAAIGAYRFAPAAFNIHHFGDATQAVYAQIGLYLLALITGALYIASLKRSKTVPLLLTWTQMLVDFGVVAATISFTGGIRSFFVFLMVIVILEAGLFLGLLQGFVFATLATIFVGVQAADPFALPAQYARYEWVDIWYRFVIQSLAFYLTAFVSGYWNQRITRMEQFQRNILDNMNSGFIVTAPDGEIVSMNRAAYEILGIADGSAVGQNVGEVMRMASGGECPALTALRRQRDFIGYEFLVVTGANQSRHIGLTTNLIRDARGRISRLIVSFSDLTEIVRMRQELQAQDRLAAVGELAAGLAHEIRNPVAAIRGAVDEIRSNLDSRDMIHKLAAIAIRESDHLNGIVSGFLDFAREPALKREKVDLRTLAAEVCDSLAHDYADKRELRIESVFPPGEIPCVVHGAQSQLRQVLMNLIHNAVEAMDGRGKATVSLAPSAASVEIRVEDEGPGIPPDKITRIFDPFYTDKENGVGMGLAICSRIVTAHDGVIWADSLPNGGARLTVRLPKA